MKWMGRIGGGLLAVCLLLGGCRQEQVTQINLFYTADVEGFFYSRPEPRLDNRYSGGYGILKSFLEKQTDPFLLFDGGNWFGSSPQGAMTQGTFVTRFLKEIPYSAGAVTAADFTFGWPALRGILREQDFPFIVSNVTLENKIPWPMHDYQIFTREGIKIGVLALVNPRVVQMHKARLSGFEAQDPVQRAREMVALLREKGVNFLIILSSLGEGEDGRNDSALAGEVAGIDLILSAYKGLENAESEQVNSTWIIYPGARLDSVASIKLTFDEQKQLKDFQFEDISLLKEIYGEDETLAAYAQEIRENARRKMAARLTQSEAEVDHVLNQESKLGDLLAECLHRWAKLDGAVLNSDSLRSSLPAGVISEYDLYNTYPYGDNITFITIRGKEFIQALEASLEVKDNFPQVAGFHVTYNPSAPAGKKIKQVILNNGRVMREGDKYRFAVTDHILAGGFGHDLFINSLEFKNTFVEARQIMRACLVKQKNLKVPSLDRWKKVK